ncbi:ABC transporter A family member 1 (ABC transporter ABCA.1) (AtABCA1) (ABC one homolog protein 1) (AtAOH1) [Durusdinium trenchii]|uniref:ABC transporter A family member 1 (ABC transporter ABCA.1) (AtABCA1) (ABC one homolog protein 1) (AtAOH1) n=1 Tax=Durusdinium trenchii TaxID=1381693 RepID=A0ABP0SMB4_9DINO
MPFEESSRFPELFEQMEQEPLRYGVELFGVSVTTLEEVFLRVGRDHTEADVAADERLQQASFVRQISQEREARRSGVSQRSPSAVRVSTEAERASSDAAVPLTNDRSRRIDPSSTASFGKHVHALLTKRYHNARRDRKAWCCQVLLPLIFLLAALLTMRFAGIGDYQAAPLSVSALPGPSELVLVPGHNVSAEAVQALMAQSGQQIHQVRGMGTCGGRIAMAARWLPWLKEVEGPMTALEFSNYLEADLPMLECRDFMDTYYRSDSLHRWGALRVVHVPDWSSPNTSYKETWLQHVGAFDVAGYARPGRVESAAMNLTVPVGTLWNEKATTLLGTTVDLFWNSSARDALPIFYQSIHQAALSQDSKIKMSNQPFPLTSAQKDLTNTQTSLNLALGFAFIPASVGAFVVLERETGSKHLQVISGVNFVSYWFSTWIWDILNYLVAATLSVLLIALFQVDSLISAEIFPWTAQNLLLIIYLFTGGILMIDLARNVLIYLFRILPNFCLADSLTNLITRQNPGLWLGPLAEFSVADWKWTGDWLRRLGLLHESPGVGCPFEGCEPYALVIAGYDLLYMGIGSIVWFAATLLLELAFATPKLRAFFQLRRIDVPREPGEPLDRQVQLEKERVQSGAADEEMVVLKGLRKVFAGRSGAPKVAVEDMYFGIPEGECFGYLGLNGAGKTTTMKMLTGEELATSGEATLGGFDIKTQQNQVRRLIGYCPQFDALIGTLTAREHLTLFARIKGMSERELHAYVDSLLDQLTLRPYADKQAFSFSGGAGTRRKLSLGLSLVGDPRCIFLDEPTTGVDPESRRCMWKLISSTMLGRAVILTTHSMEECEALCSRIGIMVNGRLVCLGSASQLKATHGYGTSPARVGSDGAGFRGGHARHVRRRRVWPRKDWGKNGGCVALLLIMPLLICWSSPVLVLSLRWENKS